MSAARWRKAMNVGPMNAGPKAGASVGWGEGAADVGWGERAAEPQRSRALDDRWGSPAGSPQPTEIAGPYEPEPPRAWRLLAPRHWLVAAALLLFPFVASPFLTFQVGAQS